MPIQTLGLRHVALNVVNLEVISKFYIDIFGMKIEWQPDKDNIYLTSGDDNLALHRAKPRTQDHQSQSLDHIGFIVKTPSDVDDAYQFLLKKKVEVIAEPKTHRDGARSLYCADPEGNVIQIIYHPPLSVDDCIGC